MTAPRLASLVSLRSASVVASLAVCAALPTVARAQAGDQKDPDGMTQELPIDVKAPPAPVLDPEAGLASLRVVGDGLRVELVAAEPLVVAPVTAAFDPAGRLWVCEMRGYMRDIDGSTEDAPEGVIAVLTDDDGDGRMDRRAEFLTGLVLPRALAFVDDGVLVLEPPRLWFCRDTDGDDACDTKELVGEGFEQGIINPEHAANSLRPGLDGWLHLARYGKRLRRAVDGSWEWQNVASGGQWGLARDDAGTWFFNTNSDFARAHFVSPRYGTDNRALSRPRFLNQRVATTQAVWPARVNIGVNRAYRRGTLRKDGRLASFTGACGAVVYRGEGPLAGDLYVAEPCANFVRRARVTWTDGAAGPRVSNRCGEEEFLASTDERFRPVDLLQGPDDGLYVVDMYRGVIQHRTFVTSYLRAHVKKLGLETPLAMGRIYRVVPDTRTRPTRVDLSRASDSELANTVFHPNGWRRDTAQRLLVERKARTASASLIAATRDTALPVAGRIQAMWTVEGLGGLDWATTVAALADAAPAVRLSALRIAERWIDGAGGRAAEPAMLDQLAARVAAETIERVRVQLALSIGRVSRDAGELRGRAEQLLAQLVTKPEATPTGALIDAVCAGLAQGELAFADALLARGGDVAPELYQRLTRCVATRRDPGELHALLTRLAQIERGPVFDAWLRGVSDGLPKPGARKVALAGSPTAFVALAESDDEKFNQRIARVTDVLDWSEGGESELPALEGPALAVFEKGQGLYAVRCVACHLVDGSGGPIAPPLAESEWVLGSPERLTRILLHGVAGPIEVAGENYNLPGMIPNADMSDADLAAIMTYMRRAWGHRADAVDPSVVQRVRAATKGRAEPWAADELEKIGND